ncbi:MAG: GNAT family N-acetyltransferase [Patescibacteria group bacterium]
MIRKITSEDWSTFKKIRLEALELEPQAFGDSYNVLSKKNDNYWKRELSKRKQIWYGVFGKSNLVGIGSIKFARSLKFNHIAHLSGIYVKKEYRGRGIGKFLFKNRIEEAFKNEKIKKLKLIVNKTQINAIGMYQSFGFKIVGDLKAEFRLKNDYFDAYLMELVK